MKKEIIKESLRRMFWGGECIVELDNGYSLEWVVNDEDGENLDLYQQCICVLYNGNQLDCFEIGEFYSSLWGLFTGFDVEDSDGHNIIDRMVRAINEAISDNERINGKDDDPIFREVREIAEEYGLDISKDNLRYDDEKEVWYFTPFEGTGMTCQYGQWWGEGIDSYSIRLMEDYFDMFDEIAKYLSDVVSEKEEK